MDWLLTGQNEPVPKSLESCTHCKALGVRTDFKFRVNMLNCHFSCEWNTQAKLTCYQNAVLNGFKFKLNLLNCHYKCECE